MGFHTRQVVSNDNTYRCARDLGARSNSGARTLIKALVADGV